MRVISSEAEYWPFHNNLLYFFRYTVFYKNTEFVGECCLSYRDLKTRYDGFEGPAPIPFRKLVEEQLKDYK